MSPIQYKRKGRCLSFAKIQNTQTHYTNIDSMKFMKTNLTYHFVCSNFTPLAIVSVNILLNIEEIEIFTSENYSIVFRGLLSNFHLKKITKLAKFNQSTKYNNYKQNTESKAKIVWNISIQNGKINDEINPTTVTHTYYRKEKS